MALDQLPSDLLAHILQQHLNVRDLVRVSQCNRALRVAARQANHPNLAYELTTPTSSNTNTNTNTNFRTWEGVGLAFSSWPHLNFVVRTTLKGNHTSEVLGVVGRAPKLFLTECKSLESFDFVDPMRMCSLSLKETNLTVALLSSLADKLLQPNSKLTSLVLAWMELPLIVVEGLANCLGENCSLTSLELARNKLGFEGIKSLGSVLHLNTNLKTLYISSNGIGAEGGVHLAASMKENHHLTKVSIANDAVPPQTIEAILRIAERNKSAEQAKQSYRMP